MATTLIDCVNCVDWTTAYEAYRLWSQMLEIHLSDMLMNNDPSLPAIDYLFEYSQKILPLIEQGGPMNKMHTIAFLPNPWRQCSTIDEVKQLNVLAQQMLINGDVWPILEIVILTDVNSIVV